MERLIILERMYELTKYIYVALKYFPKSEKFTLAAEIRNDCYNLISLIIIANKKTNKLNDLFKIDVMLGVFRYKIRLAKDLSFIPFKKYEIISEKASEIGRILGGWIKSQKKRIKVVMSALLRGGNWNNTTKARRGLIINTNNTPTNVNNNIGFRSAFGKSQMLYFQGNIVSAISKGILILVDKIIVYIGKTTKQIKQSISGVVIPQYGMNLLMEIF